MEDLNERKGLYEGKQQPNWFSGGLRVYSRTTPKNTKNNKLNISLFILRLYCSKIQMQYAKMQRQYLF